MDLKEFLIQNGGEDIGIIAKIENRTGIDNIEEICTECGSGIIDAVAVFLDTGIIDENGTIKDMADIPLWYRPYVEVFDDEDDDEDIYPAETAEKVVHISPEVILNQDDIRKIQLAKSAIAAGIDVLIKETISLV